VAHSLSSKKRARQNVKQRTRNRADKSIVKTQVKRFENAVKQSHNAEAAEKELRLAQQKIDRLAAKNQLHKNAAARKKSQLMRKLNALKAKSA
jgi:small subunit ribosomal protein S20